MTSKAVQRPSFYKQRVDQGHKLVGRRRGLPIVLSLRICGGLGGNPVAKGVVGHGDGWRRSAGPRSHNFTSGLALDV